MAESSYLLTIDQQNTVARVAKVLLEAECCLEGENINDKMDCFEDFYNLHKEVQKALSIAYYIMGVHNETEYAQILADEKLS